MDLILIDKINNIEKNQIKTNKKNTRKTNKPRDLTKYIKPYKNELIYFK